MDLGLDPKAALQNVLEKKLMGTWKLAMINLLDPSVIYLVKNSGEFIMASN